MNRWPTQHTLVVRRVCRRWHAWFRLDALRSALLLLLAFSLAEPLACFLHCQFWTHDNRTAHQHTGGHAHGHTGAAAYAGSPLFGVTSTHPDPNAQALPTADGSSFRLCAMGAEHSVPTPSAPPLPPFHDHTATITASAFLVLVALVQRVPPPLLLMLPQRSWRPLLRPPIRIPT
jgi:hypothetical protein